MMTQMQSTRSSTAQRASTTVPFIKMHGIGNDFLIIDAMRDESLRNIDRLQSAAPAWCDRRTGVGADGVLVIRPLLDDSADAEMVVINADGGIAQMCGNGLRCVCKYLVEYASITSAPLRIATGAGVLTVEYEKVDGEVSSVTVDMGVPRLDAHQIPVDLPQDGASDCIMNFPLAKYIQIPAADWIGECGLDLHMTAVSMGNPHVVMYCSNVAAIPLDVVGPFIEQQPIFPERTNVHFVQRIGDDEVRMRTWERGSGITQACGTGACAVCVAGVLTERTHRSITAHLPGGKLHLRWCESTSHVFMTGPAETAFIGSVALL